MSDEWETKDGRRRVRRDPPTVEEAVVAAQGLTDDLKEQIEIVASLMEVPAEQARGVVLRMGQRKDVDRVTDYRPGRCASRGGRRTSHLRFAGLQRRSAADNTDARLAAPICAKPPTATNSVDRRDRRSRGSLPAGARRRARRARRSQRR